MPVVGAIVGQRPRHSHGVAGFVDVAGLRVGALIRAEEERLVADDRPAQREALPRCARSVGLVDAGAIEEVVVRGQAIVLQERVARSRTKRFEPLFDTSWKLPPPLRPVAASYMLVWSLTSCSVSSAGAMLRDSVPPP